MIDEILRHAVKQKDWETVWYAILLILGSRIPTPLTKRLDLTEDIAFARKLRFGLLNPLQLDRDEAIRDFFYRRFIDEENGLALRLDVQRGAGGIVNLFKAYLQGKYKKQKAENKRTVRSAADLKEYSINSEAEDIFSQLSRDMLDPSATDLRGQEYQEATRELLGESSRAERFLTTTKELLDGNPEFRKFLWTWCALDEEGRVSFRLVAQRLGISEDTLQNHRRTWGYLETSGFEQTIVGKWLKMNGLFPATKDNYYLIQAAFGILREWAYLD